MRKKSPSIPASRILERMLAQEVRYSAMGDFEERFYAIAASKGPLHAYLFYWALVIQYLPAFLKKSFFGNLEMIKNHIKITFRQLKKHKGYSFVNISGLAVGMACCLMIMLWVQDEFSFDRHFEKAERLYRITYAEEIGGTYSHYALSPFAAAPAFTSELPEVEAFTRLLSQRGLISYQDKKFDERGILFADPDFFTLFTHVFLKGEPRAALQQPGSVVITEAAALKIFGNEEPLGKTILFNQRRELTVTGVIRNIPRQSHLRFNYLISLQSIQEQAENILNAWLSIAGWSYVLISENGDPGQIEKKINIIADNHTGERARKHGVKPFFFLQSVKDIHLKSHLGEEIGPNGDIRYVYLFSAIALFVLIIACINFMNLSTARSLTRSKEVGIRKVFGAIRYRLISQFLTESFFLATLGLVFALILMQALLPIFNRITAKDIGNFHIYNPSIWIGLFGILIFSGLIAGSYPAWLLSAYQPIDAFRRKWNKISSRFSLRNVLVIFQFAVSIFLIIGTIIVLQQIHFMKNQKLGFNQDQVLVVRIRTRAVFDQIETIKTRLMQNPRILSASLSNGIPGSINTVWTIFQEGFPAEHSHNFAVIFADYDFLDTYDIQLASGRNFSRDLVSDASGAWLINETAAAKLGWGADAIGKKIGASDETMHPIVGISKDFFFQSLKESLHPLAIQLNPNRGGYLSIKLSPINISDTREYIHSIWREFEKDRDFDYFFVDENFAALYYSEDRLSRILTVFAVVAIFVACLGLFGLASYTAEQSTKEISIRKVLGASSSGIVFLLTRSFLKWVLTANLIAWPLAYLAMNNWWLPNFSFRIHINPLVFLAAGGLSLLTALLTISSQSLKASLTDPVDILRNE